MNAKHCREIEVIVVLAGTIPEVNSSKGSSEGVLTMLPLYEEPHFTFRFADDRIIPRFHLAGIQPGQRILVFRIDPGTGEKLDLLTRANVGKGGWVDR
jgi:hypothetical protein